MFHRSLLLVLSLSLMAAGQTTKSSKPAESGSAHPAAAPEAIFHTSVGDLKCQLFPDKAPKTVENFIGLSTGKKDWTNPRDNQAMHGTPLYDGTIFHRVIPNFMIQGGDPMGQGYGGPGYKIDDEVDPSLTFDRPGRLAMANSGPNTNGSQFFITDVPTPFLNGHYSLFGQCDDASVALVKKIEQGPCGGGACANSNSKPDDPVQIKHIEIKNAPGADSTAPKKHPAATSKKKPASKQ
jgi:peptidyl-prolyl cis-trans isomerase A (cyclophilin A)